MWSLCLPCVCTASLWVLWPLPPTFQKHALKAILIFMFVFKAVEVQMFRFLFDQDRGGPRMRTSEGHRRLDVAETKSERH